MNTERITLTMKEQKMNDILVKLIAGEFKTNHSTLNKQHSNSSWHNGLPSMPSYQWIYFNGC